MCLLRSLMYPMCSQVSRLTLLGIKSKSPVSSFLKSPGIKSPASSLLHRVSCIKSPVSSLLCQVYCTDCNYRKDFGISCFNYFLARIVCKKRKRRQKKKGKRRKNKKENFFETLPSF
nr:PREDICTED: uncharacterized protein LOC109033358 [Bemisia tabaci]